MKRFICFLLSAVLFSPGLVFAATNGPASAPLANFTCTGSTCTGVPNDASHPYYANISGQSAGLALDATIQSVLSTLEAPLTVNLPSGAATSALQTTGNGFLQTLATASASQATSSNQATQITAEQTTATQTTGINTKLGGTLAVQGINAGTPVTVSTIGGTYFTDQAKIAVTSTAVQLPSHTSLIGGVAVTACNGPSPAHQNTNIISVGTSSAVTTTGDGTGNGYLLQPGSSISLSVANSNQIWINGTAGDCVSIAGN